MSETQTKPKSKPKTWNAAKAKRKLDKLWSQIIHKRDKSCTFCGRDHGKMDANHIMSRRHNATRWDVRNGNLLCFNCHRRFHDDPPWGAMRAELLVGEELYREFQVVSTGIKPFDRVVYEVTLVELNRISKELV
jgi:5-methylcytosine-specific restriction endonuclease McrA